MEDIHLPSGSELFDSFLEGGFEKDILTTIYGPPGSGKTTLCLLASIAQARQGKKVIYIDTEGGFSIERMKQLCKSELESILKYIVVVRPVNYEEQHNAIEKLKDIITDKIGLVILDTSTIFYRLELARTQDIRLVNNKLILQLYYLTEVIRKKNVPVIATNQVYSDFTSKEDFKMVGGDILRHSSKCLIKLNNNGKVRTSTLITHRSIPEGKQMNFSIINEGIVKA